MGQAFPKNTYTSSVHEAKTHLSKLLQRVEAGEEIIIARGSKPIAKLVPLKPKAAPRIPGLDRGKLRIAEDFDGPMPEDLLAAFEG